MSVQIFQHLQIIVNGLYHKLGRRDSVLIEQFCCLSLSFNIHGADHKVGCIRQQQLRIDRFSCTAVHQLHVCILDKTALNSLLRR